MAFVKGAGPRERMKDGPAAPTRSGRCWPARLRSRGLRPRPQGLFSRPQARNVLLDRDGHPKVTDFGLARAGEGGQRPDRDRADHGHASYMPPEQAAGRWQGPAADHLPLGAILYSLLTGRPPFQAASVMENAEKQVLEREPIPPRQLNPGMRATGYHLSEVLAEAPCRATPSAGALADDLDGSSRQAPSRPDARGRANGSWRWCRRNLLSGQRRLWPGLLLAVAVAGPLVAARQFALRKEADDAASDAVIAEEKAQRGRQFAQSARSMRSELHHGQTMFGRPGPRGPRPSSASPVARFAASAGRP